MSLGIYIVNACDKKNSGSACAVSSITYRAVDQDGQTLGMGRSNEVLTAISDKMTISKLGGLHFPPGDAPAGRCQQARFEPVPTEQGNLSQSFLDLLRAIQCGLSF